MQTPIYDASAQILLKDNKSESVETKFLEEMVSMDLNRVVENEVELIKSNRVLSQVVLELKLYGLTFFKGKFRDIPSYNQFSLSIESKTPENLTDIDTKVFYSHKKGTSEINIEGKTYPLDSFVKTPYGILKFHLENKNIELTEKDGYFFQLISVKTAIKRILEGLKISTNSKQTNVINLKYLDQIPVRAEKTLNSIISNYTKTVIENKNRKARNTIDFLAKRIEFVNKDLISLDNQIQLVENGSAGVNIIDIENNFQSRTNLLNQELAGIEIKFLILRELERQINGKNEQIINSLAVADVSDPILVKSLSNLSELVILKRENEVLFGSNAPTTLSIEEKISTLQKEIKTSLNGIRINLEIKKAEFENEYAKLYKTMIGIPVKGQVILELKRQQSIKNNIYIFLLQKLEEAELAFAATVSDGIVLANAVAGFQPIKPVSSSVYILGIALGIISVLLFIFLKEDLNPNVLFRAEIENRTSTRIIAEISFNNDENQIAIFEGKKTVIAEQFRALRTSIMETLANVKGGKTILFTSSFSGEGKSFLCVNLASSLALTGKKVVILELDLRKPKVFVLLNTPREPGITNYLAGKATFDEIQKDVKYSDNLKVITAGIVPANPTELIMSDKLAELLSELKTKYDYLIIDSPPIGLVTD
jgi:capsular exopolysaccharide synthesis family protein